MGEAVEQGGRELLVAENLDPFAEGQVGSNDGCPPLVSMRPRQAPKAFAIVAISWEAARLHHIVARMPAKTSRRVAL